jgi:hypothetical protein
VSLVDETKKAMGYNPNQYTCKHCKFRITKDGILDRTWVEICTFSNLCEFEVSLSATCNKFETRKFI